MATPPLDAPAPTPHARGALYARWRSEPRYRLINLETDPVAWQVVPLDMLELIAFDQCLVFGAACPDIDVSLERAARRDRVVRRSWDAVRALYARIARRMPPAHRLALLDEVAAAVEQGVSSPAALLPFITCDPDPAVRAAASSRVADLRSPARLP